MANLEVKKLKYRKLQVTNLIRKQTNQMFKLEANLKELKVTYNNLQKEIFLLENEVTIVNSKNKKKASKVKKAVKDKFLKISYKAIEVLSKNDLELFKKLGFKLA